MSMIEQAFDRHPEEIDVGTVSQSAKVDQLFAALVAFAAECPPLIMKTRRVAVPGKEGKAGYAFTYTPLHAVRRETHPHLVKNGLTVMQFPVSRTEDRQHMVGVITRVIHSSGQWVQCPAMWTPVVDKFGNPSSRTQEVGSAISYVQRYTYSPALGIVSMLDDDGLAASGIEGTTNAVKTDKETGESCPKCGKALRLRSGSKGEFLGCSGYPACKYTRNLDAPQQEPVTSPEPKDTEVARKKLRETIKKSGNASGMDDTALSVWIKGMGHDTRTCELDTLQGCLNLLPEVSRQWKDWRTLTDGEKDIATIVTPDKHFLQLSAEERDKALAAARDLVAEGVPY